MPLGTIQGQIDEAAEKRFTAGTTTITVSDSSLDKSKKNTQRTKNLLLTGLCFLLVFMVGGYFGVTWLSKPVHVVPDAARTKLLAQKEPVRPVEQSILQKKIVSEQPIKITKSEEEKPIILEPLRENPRQVLTKAQSEFAHGNYDRAIELANSVAKTYNKSAWRIIGAAACRKKDVKLVQDAFLKLDNAGRQYLIYVCQREGIVQTRNTFDFLR